MVLRRRTTKVRFLRQMFDKSYPIMLVPYHPNAPFHHFTYGENLRKSRVVGRKARHRLSRKCVNTAMFNRSVQID